MHFAAEVRSYFEDLKITAIEGEDLSGTVSCLGIGYQTAKIRIMPSQIATVTYQAVVADNAPERFILAAMDDGNGYLNTAKHLKSGLKKPDGTEGQN